jgi:RNA polymerase sigma-70 factor (ECF subfamily)
MKQALAELSDEELARQARAGSSACFEQLVRRHQVPLLRFLERRMGRRSDAEDVVQEAFVRAYQCLGQYSDSRSFRTWLFTIGYRMAISQLRKVRARETAEANGESSAAGESPGERLGREEEGRRLWGVARAVLSEEQFAGVWLYYVEEMSAGEVAQVLGRSWVAVKTMLHRARKRLLPHVAAVVGREDEQQETGPVHAGQEVKAGGL